MGRAPLSVAQLREESERPRRQAAPAKSLVARNR